MANGYVYILINQSFFHLIKVGRTTNDPKDRARELSSASGVPTPFKVAYSVFSSRISYLESAMHRQLSEYRENKNREFFRYPLDQAISLLQNLSREGDQEAYESFDVTKTIRNVYDRYLYASLSYIRILKKNERVYLELTLEDSGDGFRDEHVHRYDLGFVTEHTGHYFPFTESIQTLADRFTKLDPFSILNVAGEMFDFESGPLKNVSIDETWRP